MRRKKNWIHCGVILRVILSCNTLKSFNNWSAFVLPVLPMSSPINICNLKSDSSQRVRFFCTWWSFLKTTHQLHVSLWMSWYYGHFFPTHRVPEVSAVGCSRGSYCPPDTHAVWTPQDRTSQASSSPGSEGLYSAGVRCAWNPSAAGLQRMLGWMTA